MTLVGSSTFNASRRIYDPSWGTFVRSSGLLRCRLLRAAEKAPLAPLTYARSGLHPLPRLRCATRQPPRCPSEQHHPAPRSAIQIP